MFTGTMKSYEKCDDKECNITDASNSAIEKVYENHDSDLDNADSWFYSPYYWLSNE